MRHRAPCIALEHALEAFDGGPELERMQQRDASVEIGGDRGCAARLEVDGAELLGSGGPVIVVLGGDEKRRQQKNDDEGQCTRHGAISSVQNVRRLGARSQPMKLCWLPAYSDHFRRIRRRERGGFRRTRREAPGCCGPLPTMLDCAAWSAPLMALKVVGAGLGRTATFLLAEIRAGAGG
jgi:hypothetical protein